MILRLRQPIFGPPLLFYCYSYYLYRLFIETNSFSMKENYYKNEYETPDSEAFIIASEGALAESTRPGFNAPFNNETNW